MELVFVADDGTVHPVVDCFEDFLDYSTTDVFEVCTKLRVVIRSIEKERIQGLIIDCLVDAEPGIWLEPDGHTIHAPEYYLDKGMPFEFVGRFVLSHKSGSGKKQIFTDGGPVKELLGVYNLLCPWLLWPRRVPCRAP